jgi:hypothetical protein
MIFESAETGEAGASKTDLPCPKKETLGRECLLFGKAGLCRSPLTPPAAGFPSGERLPAAASLRSFPPLENRTASQVKVKFSNSSNNV